MLNPLPIERGIALSYGLQALIMEDVEQNGGQVSLESIAKAALKIYPEALVKEGLENLARRFSERVARMASAFAATPATSPEVVEKSASLGMNLRQWSEQVDPNTACFYLADFNPDIAYHLYWKVEADLLDAALKAKLKFQAMLHINQYEATMYGFGGKYKDDTEEESSNAETYDMDSQAGISALESFGFGTL